MVSSETLSACPLCSSSNVAHLDQDFHFDRCATCGLVFDNPRPTTEAIAGHYSRTSQYDSWLDSLNAREKMWKRRLKKMLPDVVPGTLLDVGTGIGQFLAVARPFFTAVYGTEVSTSAISIGRERYNLTVLHGSIDELELPRVDNLTMIHVLEHVGDPAATLRRCHALLNPGGRLFVCVPNDLRSWTSRLRAIKSRLLPNGNSPMIGLPRWESTHEIHLSHFNGKSLAFAAKLCGFRVLRMDIDPYFVASGARLLANQLNFGVHKMFGFSSFQALWMVAERI